MHAASAQLLGRKSIKGLFRLPIFHIASMARSGETLLLRTLAAHSKIHVVHNLRKQDTVAEERLFKTLMGYRKKSIWRWSGMLAETHVGKAEVLLLKQSVWEHPYEFDGFIFARNPFSIYASLKYYDVPYGRNDWEPFWEHNTSRFLRWLQDIDIEVTAGFRALSPVQQFCMFYNRRMASLLKTGLPVIHYEGFVSEPVAVLKKILAILGLNYEEGMVNSHKAYSLQEEGHGKIDLSRPIATDSIYQFVNRLTNRECIEIEGETGTVYRALGYAIEPPVIRINGQPVPD